MHAGHLPPGWRVGGRVAARPLCPRASHPGRRRKPPPRPRRLPARPQARDRRPEGPARCAGGARDPCRWKGETREARPPLRVPGREPRGGSVGFSFSGRRVRWGPGARPAAHAAWRGEGAWSHVQTVTPAPTRPRGRFPQRPGTGGLPSPGSGPRWPIRASSRRARSPGRRPAAILPGKCQSCVAVVVRAGRGLRLGGQADVHSQADPPGPWPQQGQARCGGNVGREQSSRRGPRA